MLTKILSTGVLQKSESTDSLRKVWTDCEKGESSKKVRSMHIAYVLNLAKKRLNDEEQKKIDDFYNSLRGEIRSVVDYIRNLSGEKLSNQSAAKSVRAVLSNGIKNWLRFIPFVQANKISDRSDGETKMDALRRAAQLFPSGEEQDNQIENFAARMTLYYGGEITNHTEHPTIWENWVRKIDPSYVGDFNQVLRDIILLRISAELLKGCESNRSDFGVTLADKLIDNSDEPLKFCENNAYSIENAHAMVRVAQLVYETEGKIRDTVEKWGYLLRGKAVNGKLFHFEFKEDIQGMLIGDKSRIIVAFRGTTTASDFWTDSQVVWRTKCGEGLGHHGFKNSADKIWVALQDKIRTFVKQNALKSISIWFTGHSLGGAMATVAAQMIDLDIEKQDSTNCCIYTFGQPRTGNKRFAQQVERKIGKENWHRFVHAADPIPTVPLAKMGFEHGGTLHYITDDGRILDSGGISDDASLPSEEELESFFQAPIQHISRAGDHSLIHYQSRLNSHSSHKTQSTIDVHKAEESRLVNYTKHKSDKQRNVEKGIMDRLNLIIRESELNISTLAVGDNALAIGPTVLLDQMEHAANIGTVVGIGDHAIAQGGVVMPADSFTPEQKMTLADQQNGPQKIKLIISLNEYMIELNTRPDAKDTIIQNIIDHTKKTINKLSDRL